MTMRSKFRDRPSNKNYQKKYLGFFLSFLLFSRNFRILRQLLLLREYENLKKNSIRPLGRVWPASRVQSGCVAGLAHRCGPKSPRGRGPALGEVGHGEPATATAPPLLFLSPLAGKKRTVVEAPC
jgi:hypothetical protein